MRKIILIRYGFLTLMMMKLKFIVNLKITLINKDKYSLEKIFLVV